MALYGLSAKQVAALNATRRDVRNLKGVRPAEGRPVAGAQWNDQLIEIQSGTPDEDGYFDGWVIFLGSTHLERHGKVKVLSVNHWLAGGQFYFCRFWRLVGEIETPVFLAGMDDEFFAELVELKDDDGPTEYGWKPLTPTSGGTYSAGDQVGFVRAWVRTWHAQEGNGVDVRAKQAVAIIGATGGQYTLDNDGEETAPLDFDHDDADLESAIEALSNETAVTVTGAGTFDDPFIVEYLDDFDPRPLLVADYDDLTPNVSRNVAYELHNRRVNIEDGTRRAILKPGFGERGYVHAVKTQRGNGVDERTIYNVWRTGVAYGEFSLVFEGEEADGIQWDDDAAAVEAKLEALPNLTAVSVTGAGTVDDKWEITIEDDYDDHDDLTVMLGYLVGTIDYRFQGPDLGRSVVTNVECDEEDGLDVTETDV